MLMRIALVLLAATLCSAGPDQASPLDPAYLKLYGGTYSTDCKHAQADRLNVLADRLLFVSGDRELVAKDIEADVSYWGRFPPANFEIALMGQVKPDRGLLFLVYRDKRGLYIQLDGHPDVLEDIGHSPGDETQYLMCGADAE